MSRSVKGGKDVGYEYWKSRYQKYGWWEDPGPTTKRLTHRKERRDAKDFIRREQQ